MVWYHHRPPTTYGLATIHALHTNRDDISYTQLDLTVGQKLVEIRAVELTRKLNALTR